MSTRQEYNANNQLVGQHWTVGSTTYSETYTYSKTDGALTSYNNALGQTINLEYDALRRISKVTTPALNRYYAYADGKESGQTTGLVSRYWYGGGSYDDAYFKYSYSYDALGNISSYTQSGTTYTYTYDDQNQLLTQTGGGKTYTYTYDNAGNILTASNGTTTNSYTYGNALWRDLLTAYNGNYIAYEGQTVSNGVVTGDVIGGNPISYYNGKRYTFTWEEGRNLVSAVEGTNTYSYTYDSNGLRTSKTVNGVKHEYLYASGRLLRETYGDVILDFVYDHNGHPFALNYTVDGTSTRYYYITNLQGDVLAMITGSGTVVASYSYDPYGKVISATKEMADVNPLRYRGYYYDEETSFYYLQSRYYDPTICRFINADSYISTGQGVLGCNMFAYCGSNPPNCFDDTGCLLQVLRDRTVHNMVLTIICGRNKDLRMDKTCVYYNGKNIGDGFGYCDLYNVVTGEVWELKKDTASPSCTTAAAQLQLEGYISGSLKHHPDLGLKMPYMTIIEAGTFEFTDGLYVYHVNYWYEGYGILRYSYTYTKTKAAKAIEFLFAMSMLFATAYYNAQAEQYGFPKIQTY